MSPDGLVTGEVAPVVSSDLDGGDTSFDVISAGVLVGIVRPLARLVPIAQKWHCSWVPQ